MPEIMTSAEISAHQDLSVVYDLFYDVFMCVHSFYSSNSHSPSPPSSTNAFSLLSASSEQDNPSTSGCRLNTNTHDPSTNVCSRIDFLNILFILICTIFYIFFYLSFYIILYYIII